VTFPIWKMLKESSIHNEATSFASIYFEMMLIFFRTLVVKAQVSSVNSVQIVVKIQLLDYSMNEAFWIGYPYYARFLC